MSDLADRINAIAEHLVEHRGYCLECHDIHPQELREIAAIVEKLERDRDAAVQRSRQGWWKRSFSLEGDRSRAT